MIANLKKIIKITIWSYQFQFRALGLWAGFYFLRNIYDNIQTLLYSFFLGKLINEIIALNGTNLTSSLVKPIVAIVITWLLGQLLHLDDYLLRFYRYEKIRLDFMQDILKKITELDWRRIEEPNTEKMLRSILDNGSWPLHSYVDSISYLLTIIVGFVFALQTVELGWVLILALLLGALPTGLQTLWYTYVDARVYDALLPQYVKLGGIRDFFHSSNILFESKINRAEHYLRDLEAKERRTNLNIYFARFSKLFWTNIITLFTSVGSNVYVLWYLVQRVVNQALSIGDFQYYLTVFNKLKSDVTAIFSSIGQIEDGYRYLVHFYTFMHLKPYLADGEYTLSANSDLTIRFNNVDFAYPESKLTALKGINVTIKPGEKIALVGENGAGKSTFIRLLLRAYDPTSGEVVIDGKPLSAIKKDSWYKKITMIPQDFARYDILSVAENIALEKDVELPRIKEAAKLSEAHDFISKLPKQYQSILSRKMEEGVELSSGQWQKIGLARVFFNNTDIVILDEPTASIDPVAEYNIFKNVYKSLKNKTVILVSHRYSTVRDADRILVFNGGKIVEQGTFEQLLKNNGYFAHSYKLQKEAKSLKA